MASTVLGSMGTTTYYALDTTPTTRSVALGSLRGGAKLGQPPTPPQQPRLPAQGQPPQPQGASPGAASDLGLADALMGLSLQTEVPGTRR